MVLVDRRKFESLARRMTHLEAQLDALDQPATVKGSGGLKDMFSDPAELVKDEDEMLNDLLSATSIDSAGTMQPMQLEDPPEPENDEAEQRMAVPDQPLQLGVVPVLSQPLLLPTRNNLGAGRGQRRSWTCTPCSEGTSRNTNDISSPSAPSRPTCSASAPASALCSSRRFSVVDTDQS